MWILKKDPNKAKIYRDWMKEKLSASFDKNGLFIFHYSNSLKQSHINGLKRTKAYKYLTLARVEEYLTAAPQDLIRLHDLLENEIAGQRSRKNNDEVIAHIFNYKKYFDKNFAYKVAGLVDVNTCCYCNRLYTLTVSTKKGEALIRPTFDHWFPQYKYPDLALSYYNLIPSCSLCNTFLKHDNDRMNLNDFIHPYVDKKAYFKFTYRPLAQDLYQVDTVIKAPDQQTKLKVENTLDLFKIKDIYDAHSEFELKDLLDLKQEYPGDYIETLVSNVMKDLGISEEEVYWSLFGIETQEDKYLNRPFSKFKTDILAEIKANPHVKQKDNS